MKAIRRFSVRPVLPARIAALGDLAMNLRWSWHPPLRDLFESIDPARWATVGQDPVAMLSAVEPDELERLAADPAFVERVDAAKEALDRYLGEDRWYQQWGREQAEGVPSAIAYFSAEFGITAALPQYSGGLGILAGDHLKAASDIGVPIVGVGLFYKTGYFRQSLNRDGWQQEDYPVLDPDGLPLSLLREEDGTPAGVTIELPGGRELHAHVWRAQVGRVPLLLLDSDVHENDEAGAQRHRAPLRRRRRAAPAAGDAARDGRRARAAAVVADSPVPRSPTSTTPTRATPASSASSGSASSCGPRR